MYVSYISCGQLNVIRCFSTTLKFSDMCGTSHMRRENSRDSIKYQNIIQTLTCLEEALYTVLVLDVMEHDKALPGRGHERRNVPATEIKSKNR